MKNEYVVTLLVVATLVVAAAALLYITEHPLNSQSTTTVSGPVSCTTYSTSYVVIADHNGFNNSVAHGVPKNSWPIICVHKGDVVHITVMNKDTVEPHGFAISHYLPAGVTVTPNNSYTLTFTADSTGDFQVYCNVFCSMHWAMLSGVLVVS